MLTGSALMFCGIAVMAAAAAAAAAALIVCRRRGKQTEDKMNDEYGPRN
jgi:hypothetical protein